MTYESKICNIKYGYRFTNHFHHLLWRWFRWFDLQELGLIVGHQNKVKEDNKTGDEIKGILKENFDSIKDVHTVDLKGADYNYDLVCPGFSPKEKYNWIICQAFLEHVADPVAVMRNLLNSLKPKGKIYLHTVGVGFKYHAHPIDCFRFLEDAFYKWEKLLNIKLIDIGGFHKNRHIFILYEKIGDSII